MDPIYPVQVEIFLDRTISWTLPGQENGGLDKVQGDQSDCQGHDQELKGTHCTVLNAQNNWKMGRARSVLDRVVDRHAKDRKLKSF